jgi:hypothetical protein
MEWIKVKATFGSLYRLLLYKRPDRGPSVGHRHLCGILPNCPHRCLLVFVLAFGTYIGSTCAGGWPLTARLTFCWERGGSPRSTSTTQDSSSTATTVANCGVVSPAFAWKDIENRQVSPTRSPCNNSRLAVAGFTVMESGGNSTTSAPFSRTGPFATRTRGINGKPKPAAVTADNSNSRRVIEAVDTRMLPSFGQVLRQRAN